MLKTKAESAKNAQNIQRVPVRRSLDVVYSVDFSYKPAGYPLGITRPVPKRPFWSWLFSDKQLNF
jgi:hypothetical protein